MKSIVPAARRWSRLMETTTREAGEGRPRARRKRVDEHSLPVKYRVMTLPTTAGLIAVVKQQVLVLGSLLSERQGPPRPPLPEYMVQ